MHSMFAIFTRHNVLIICVMSCTLEITILEEVSFNPMFWLSFNESSFDFFRVNKRVF